MPITDYQPLIGSLGDSTFVWLLRLAIEVRENDEGNILHINPLSGVDGMTLTYHYGRLLCKRVRDVRPEIKEIWISHPDLENKIKLDVDWILSFPTWNAPIQPNRDRSSHL